MYPILSAFLLGFLGSVHCLGMCAPLVLAMPRQERPLLAAFFYHLGKSGGYALMGLVLGLLGWGVSLLQWQQGLSIALGFMLLLSLMGAQLSKAVKLPGLPWLKRQLAEQLIRAQGLSGAFFLGLFNGWLPCGLSYLALSGAVVQGDPLRSAAFMFAFGLGTAPMLLAVLVFKQQAPLAWRQALQRVLPFLVAVVAVLLIVRGMGLGIPFLSPAASPLGDPNCG